MGGIEPPSTLYESAALPLSYTGTLPSDPPASANAPAFAGRATLARRRNKHNQLYHLRLFQTLLTSGIITKPKMKSKEIKSWDHYWEGDGIKSKRFFYNIVASSYRRFLIRPYLNRFMKKYFKAGAKVLHAGCGGGEVDVDLQTYLDITAMDFSENALKKYRVMHAKECKILSGDIRSLKFKSSSFDGVYNLGVLEHFRKDEIEKILNGFRRVLKKKGTLVIFWPPEFGVSVSFFKILVFICRNILGIKNIEFHPPEVSRLQSKDQAKKIFNHSGFRVIDTVYGLRDLFTYVVIVAKKR